MPACLWPAANTNHCLWLVDEYARVKVQSFNTEVVAVHTNLVHNPTCAQYVAPCSDIEVVVQGVWQQVLGLESPPSVESDFFAIGGTSLIGLKVTAAMRKALGFNASLPGAHALQTVSTCFLWYHQVPERRLSCDARTLCGSANLS